MLRHYFWFPWLCLGALLAIAFGLALLIAYQNVEYKRLGYRLGELVTAKRELSEACNELAVETLRLEERVLRQLVETSGIVNAATPSLPVWEISTDAHEPATP
jgi:hypothetical protein